MIPFQHTDGRGHSVIITSLAEGVRVVMHGRSADRHAWTTTQATLSKHAVEALHLGLSGRETAVGVLSDEGYGIQVRLDRIQQKLVVQINEGPDVELDFGALAFLGLSMAARKLRI